MSSNGCHHVIQRRKLPLGSRLRRLRRLQPLQPLLSAPNTALTRRASAHAHSEHPVRQAVPRATALELREEKYILTRRITVRNFSLSVTKAGSAVCGGKVFLRFPVASAAPPPYGTQLSNVYSRPVHATSGGTASDPFNPFPAPGYCRARPIRPSIERDLCRPSAAADARSIHLVHPLRGLAAVWPVRVTWFLSVTAAAGCWSPGHAANRKIF